MRIRKRAAMNKRTSLQPHFTSMYYYFSFACFQTISVTFLGDDIKLADNWKKTINHITFYMYFLMISNQTEENSFYKSNAINTLKTISEIFDNKLNVRKYIFFSIKS